MNTPWFRMYSEVLSDRKLAAIAMQCSQPRAIIIGAWTTVLCLANDSPDRGALMLTENHPVGVPAIAAELGLSADATAAIVAAFVEFGLLLDADGRLAVRAWHDRQFSSDSSSERVATYRNRKRQSNVTETLHDRYSNTPELEQKQNRTETDSAADAAAPATSLPEDVKPTDHPAITVWRETHDGKYPAKAMWPTLIQAVGEQPADLARWRQVVTAYIGCGWNPANLSGMLDWYTRNETPHASRANGNGKPAAAKAEKTRQQQDYWDSKARARGLPV